jgi:hypothetical protein
MSGYADFSGRASSRTTGCILTSRSAMSMPAVPDPDHASGEDPDEYSWRSPFKCRKSGTILGETMRKHLQRLSPKVIEQDRGWYLKHDDGWSLWRREGDAAGLAVSR